ncbi:hypothetical protein HNO88_000083 [Novosphingobium chloroacetimidivorans]|uniref:Uncharacterized protein n=1 Tax=Novosphingobium chloroacetimidivorans TaxID=1428314 RepID=A0A7W7K6H8_9SPHN|nr:hypothetical protein [Novosphingobium chloroacetimidivorans]MBB4856786.1 hypothetical protein [Novosphingobium chloroacetimidivorans]
MRNLAIFGAAALAALPGMAHAAAPCLTPAEASSLAAYALPAAITGTTKRCTPTLAPGAFLRKGGAELAGRYAARKAQNWPLAKAAFFKIGGGSKDQSSDLLKQLPDPSLQQMLDAIIEGMVAQEIPTEKCGEIDRIVGLLAPLPAQNTADLIAVVVGLAGKSGKAKSDKFAICKA